MSPVYVIMSPYNNKSERKSPIALLFARGGTDVQHHSLQSSTLNDFLSDLQPEYNRPSRTFALARVRKVRVVRLKAQSERFSFRLKVCVLKKGHS